MWRKAFQFLLFGALFYLIGALFAVPARNFIATAEPATLIVLQIDTRRDTDGDWTYRPVFGLVTDEQPRPEYAGNIWTHPQPHSVGDIVEGRYDASTGEMRSDQMAKKTLWAGRFAQAIGLLLMLQGVLMFFGVPEYVLPLRFSRR